MKAIDFDEMLDPAFAEVYRIACELEHAHKIDPQENPTEEFCKDCKQIASDYVDWWGENSEDFWGDIYGFAEKKLIELYPPTRCYIVQTFTTVMEEHSIYAVDESDAKKREEQIIAYRIKSGDIVSAYVGSIKTKE